MTDSNATYNTSITCDLPDYPNSNVTFRNEAYFTSGNNEVFPGLRYTLTLDANGQGTQVLPCPDNTGTTAANWRITMPSRESVTSAIAYSATPQLLSDILAAGSTTTDPDDIIAALANKVSKSGDTMTGDLTFSDAGVVAADTISANTSYTETGSEAVGALWWNQDEETLNLKVDSAVALQLGQETFFNVTNQTGSQIDNGTPVMFAGTLGASGRLLIQLAIADGTIAPSYSMGIATEDIANGANGKVTWFGKVRGIDTTGTPYGEVWNDGDILYVSPATAGYLTNVQPSAPDRAIEIAAVVHAHATVGTLFVRPTWSPKLTELDDVDGTPLTTDGQFLVWDNTAGYFDASANTADFLTVANNLSDLDNAATARTNLAVYGTADHSAAPTAAEPLKGDGTGGITLDHLGISGVDESITLPKSGSGEHIMLVSDPTTNASGSRIVSNGSQGQQLIFDLDFGNLSNFEEFKIRFNNSQVPFVVTRLYQVGVNQPTPTGQMDVVNGSASRIVTILKAFAGQSVDVLQMQDSAGATMTSFAKNGAWKPPSLADAAAENNTVYYSTDAAKLVYKDSGGTVNALY